MHIRNTSKNPQFLPSRPSPLSSTDDVGSYNRKATPHHVSISLISSSSSAGSASDMSLYNPSEPSSIISHESRQRYIRQQMEKENVHRKNEFGDEEEGEEEEEEEGEDTNIEMGRDIDDDDDDDVDPLSVASPPISSTSITPSPMISPIPSRSQSPMSYSANFDTSPADAERSSSNPEATDELLTVANVKSNQKKVILSPTPSSNYTKSVPPGFFNKLRSFPLFKHAPKSFHTRIVSKLKLIQHHAQDFIIKKGDPARSMYWILKGNVAVTSTDGESIYAELIPGAFFGEIGILFNRPRTATVVAKTKVLLGVLTSESLNMVLPEYPSIERRIRDEAQERLAILEKKSRSSRTNLANIMPIGSGSVSPLLRVPSPLIKEVFPTPNHPVVSFNSMPGANKNFGGFSFPAESGSTPSPSQNAGSNLKANAYNESPLLPVIDMTNELPSISRRNSKIAPLSISSILSPLTPAPSIPPIKHLDHDSNSSSDPKTTDNVDFTISIQEFIKSLPIFQNLPSNIIHQLALGVEPLSFQPFEYIFRKDDIGSDIYFIIIGEVEVIDVHNSNANYEKCLARLGYGSYFGEMSFLLRLNSENTDDCETKIDARRSANIRTISNCELIVVRHDKLEEICKTYPFLIEEMRKTAGERNALNMSKTDNHRLSINFLMNDIDIPNSPILSIALERVPLSRGASKRKIDTAPSEEENDESQTQKSQPINLSLPPLNPQIPSINKFRPHESQHHHQGHLFKYLPHHKRARLASIGGIEKPSKLRNSTISDSLLLKVFEYLTLPELMRARIVCKRWRQLLYFAPNLFQVLDLTKWNTSIDDKSLINITDFVGARPKVIDISNCFHITDEGFSYMINEIGILGLIKVLRMSSIWEVSAMAIMDLSVPSVGKFLEELDLSNCRKVRDNVLERLFGWSKNVMPPKELHGHHGHHGLHENDDSFDLSIGCKNLKKLNVGYCKHLTDGIMYHISIHASETLEILNLTRCTTITDRGFSYWAYVQFPKLRELSLKDCTFLTDQSISSIASAAKNLEHLNLNFCCALSDAAIEVLCMGCPFLRTLDLSFCGSAVSDASLVKISLHLKHLEKLVVKGCVRVTRAGIDSILSGCLSLYFLDVSQCKNAHIYPGKIPAQKLNVNAQTKSAFVTAGPYQNVIEIVI